MNRFLLSSTRAAVVYCLGVSWCQAQQNGTLSGLVTDPSGARVPDAQVHMLRDGVTRDAVTDSTGRFSAVLPAGTYEVSVTAAGFDRATRTPVRITGGIEAEASFKLKLAPIDEQISVPSTNRLGTGGAENGSALVFEGDSLALLPDDARMLSNQLRALAGGRSPQFYVDGFSGGRLPPKSSIRMIRINENPYSAQYEQQGTGRIEIFTSSASDALHGELHASGYDQSFNAPNPFTPIQPPYHSLNLEGWLSGPIGKKTSYFASGDYWDLASNAVVNAFNISTAVPNPTTTGVAGLRIDRDLPANNKLTARYDFNRTRNINAGVGLLVLPSEAFDGTLTGQTLQIANTEIITPKIVNETHFQYIRSRNDQASLDHSPTIIVEGAFNGGGSSVGDQHDATDRYEIQDDLSSERKQHLLRAGVRYRLQRESNSSSANYNGQFTFPDLATYNAAQAGAESGATQYTVTTGKPDAIVLTGDVALYAEDEWKLTKSFTVDYGLRFESQTAIADHADWAPRAGFGWAIGRRGAKSPWVFLHAGAGLFYDRFDAASLLSSVRQNGVSQQTYVVTDPQFFHTIPSPSQLGAALPPTTYTVSPRLKAQTNFVSSLSLDRQFGKVASVTAVVNQRQGSHLYISHNLNAPLPGTYVYGDPTSGTRPLGGIQNVYQYGSDATASSTEIYANGVLNLSKSLTMYWFYEIAHERGTSAGAGSFPSEPYNLRADYGRLATNQQSFFLAASANLPSHINFRLSMNYASSTPFNITIGNDLNGDAQYNDRPAFATDLTRASVRTTRYGTFDLAPMPGQRIIPLNYGRGPGQLWVQLNLGKTFKIGPMPRLTATTTAGSAAAATTKPATPARPERPYELEFEVEADNVLNIVNPASPDGVLNSPLFGKYLSLNSGFISNSAANRTVVLRSRFHF